MLICGRDQHNTVKKLFSSQREKRIKIEKSCAKREHDKNPQDQINKEEIGKLPEKEVREMIAKMIQNLKNGMEKIQESLNTFSKELEEINDK